MSLASLLGLKMTMNWTRLSAISLDNKPTFTTLQMIMVIMVLCDSVWHCQNLEMAL